jgi:hypothetical protein
MTLREDLKYFLKTGRLKNVEFGITRSQLIDKCGNTEWLHYTSSKSKYPSIYKFGRFEFYFDEGSKGKLIGMMFQPIPTPAENGNMLFNYNRLNYNTSINKLKDYLTSLNINFKELDDEFDKELKLIITEGDVTMFLDCQNSNQYVLHKAGRFIER